MDKLTYIVKTLSRTKRKDFENYVVNAVWQRLGDASLKPVTQQLVRRADGGRYFIDLYFPQLKVGVECDEGYHDAGDQPSLDQTREVELIDIIRQVTDEGYTPLHVRVGGRSLEEVDAQVDECVSAIKAEAAIRRSDGSFPEWLPDAPAHELLAGKSTMHVSDDIGFRSIAEACNEVMGCSYDGMQRSFFPPAGLKSRGIDTYAWFPKLSVDGETPATASGWVNSLSPDGSAIYERNAGVKDWRQVAFPDRERLVFAHMRDPVTSERLYRFVGVFRFAELGRNASGADCNVYRRVSDGWAIVRADPA